MHKGILIVDLFQNWEWFKRHHKEDKKWKYLVTTKTDHVFISIHNEPFYEDGLLMDISEEIESGKLDGLIERIIGYEPTPHQTDDDKKKEIMFSRMEDGMLVGLTMIASVLSVYMRALEQYISDIGLVEWAKNPENATAIAEHVDVLMNKETDKEYLHPQNDSMAGYLVALSQSGNDEAFKAALKSFSDHYQEHNWGWFIIGVYNKLAQ
jgi:hypothetical protein